MNEEAAAPFLIATHDPRVMAHAGRIIKLEDSKVFEKPREFEVRYGHERVP
jgi:ABC-type lipoprotein export system ATPase subunit